MVSFNIFQQKALSFPETTEDPHFEKIAFKVKNKIFATYDHKLHRACIKLSAIDQGVFSIADKSIIFPVDNKWGKQGWTIIELTKVNEQLFMDALTTAYYEVAPRKRSEEIKKNRELI